MKAYNYFKIGQIIFVITLIVWIIYGRLFRINLIRELPAMLYNSEQYLLLFCYVILFLLVLSKLIISLNHLLIKRFKPWPWLEKCQHYYYDALWTTVSFIDSFFPYGYYSNLWASANRYLALHWSSFGKQLLFIVVVYFVPQSIMLTALIADIFVYNEFHYIYLFGWIILLPLIWRIFFAVSKEIWKNNMERLDDIIYFIDKSDFSKTYKPSEYFLMIQSTGNFDESPLAWFTKKELEEQLLISEKTNTILLLDVSLDGFVYNQFIGIFFPIGIFITIHENTYGRISKYSSVIFNLAYVVIWGYVLYICF